MMKNGAGAPPAPAVAVRDLRVARGGREILVGLQRYDGEARVLGH